MSRDLTPRELDYIQKQYNIPNITLSLVDENNNPVFSEEQRELAIQFPRLGAFGFDMLNFCRDMGVLNDKRGLQLLKEVESYFNGATINKELANTTQSWYEGKLEADYYMDNNNQAFASYLLHKMKQKD